DSAAANRVFGAPITTGDVTVLPVARVSGGGGGGAGPGGADAATGTGGGLGLTARPLGVFVIRGEAVTWRPALDVNKVVLGGQLVAVTALLTVRAVARARRAAARR
ncbi:MAG TPA: spore germination protein GerW family protein, partial [Pilimelia sp.]|nr:spore germination protein GerW family protein [Pilimelia sp.]